jgi:Tol biopolymer transport system component
MRKRELLLFTVLVALVGCNGTLEVGIEHTPTPDHAMAATVAVLVDENNRLATRVALQVPPLPTSASLGQLAYVQGGDIWIMDLLHESSLPRRMTVDGRNREPRWSPSGKWLAFRKERSVSLLESPGTASGDSLSTLRRQVWLIQADGNSEHPLSQGSPVETFAWSPKSDRLAYTTPAGGLYTINADGTDLITLVPENLSVPTGQNYVGRISWNPGGNWIAYEWLIQPASRPPVYQGLWMVPAEGGARVELYNSGIPDKSQSILAGWSSLGTDVLFWQSQLPNAALVDGAELYATSGDESQPKSNTARRVANDTILTYADFVAPAPHSTIWQAQGAVAYVAGEGKSTWKNKRIQSVGQSITGNDMAAISPAWSPDGTRLAFAAMPDRSDLESGELEALMQRRIWVASAFGGPQLRCLTNTTGYRDERPSWSADGGYILFVRMDAKGRTSLWIVSSSGGPPRQVVDELTPAPDPLDSYGHVDWDALFDWWRGP